jgi:hypothetical protein
MIEHDVAVDAYAIKTSTIEKRADLISTTLTVTYHVLTNAAKRHGLHMQQLFQYIYRLATGALMHFATHFWVFN